ncbi:LysE family translocator [Streptomyces abyssomicinicus]|uniref:LysE family translocator n=1 Tax=Streptomyces abyssomicinicus TaxID=574929 RepID=UPI0012503BF2|nr:LysE family translocator [Streptomyces abyssomicinicus]
MDALWAFTLMVGLLTLTPGLDTALVLRTAAVGHRRRALGVIFGIQTGTLVWGVLTSLGVTALLTASHLTYDVLRWAGAAYLVWMGCRMLWSARRRPGGTEGEEAGTEAGTGAGAGEAAAAGAGAGTDAGDTLLGGWRQGLATNLLNPKVGAFYVALLPQFIPPDAPHLAAGVLLSGIHVLLGSAWACVLIALAQMLRHRLQRPSVRRRLDRVTGTVIAGFGVRLALEK